MLELKIEESTVWYVVQLQCIQFDALKLAVEIRLTEIPNLKKLSFGAIEAKANEHLATSRIAEQAD